MRKVKIKVGQIWENWLGTKYEVADIFINKNKIILYPYGEYSDDFDTLTVYIDQDNTEVFHKLLQSADHMDRFNIISAETTIKTRDKL